MGRVILVLERTVGLDDALHLRLGQPGAPDPLEGLLEAVEVIAADAQTRRHRMPAELVDQAGHPLGYQVESVAQVNKVMTREI